MVGLDGRWLVVLRKNLRSDARVHLRGHSNILKRLLIHTGGIKLGLLMRQLIGVGTLRGLQGRLRAVVTTLLALTRSLSLVATSHGRLVK